jgi:hypothetical protein
MKLSKIIRVNFDITDHILIRYMTFKIQEKNITAHQLLTYYILDKANNSVRMLRTVRYSH